MRAKRATFTFLVDKNSFKITKKCRFGEFLKKLQKVWYAVLQFLYFIFLDDKQWCKQWMQIIDGFFTFFFNLIMIKTVFFIYWRYGIFWKIVSLGEKRKKKWIVICVWKIRIFLLRGFFHHFFYKIHFKEIKTESNWKKREYFIVSFFEGYFFFSFFSSTNYWYFEGVFCWFFFWGWGIFSVS